MKELLGVNRYMVEEGSITSTNDVLQQSVDHLKGVGEKTAQELAAMNIYSIKDLLEYFPFRYNVFEMKPLQALEHNEQATIIGQVSSEPIIQFYGRKRSRLTFNLFVENVTVRAVIFNRPFAKNHIQLGDSITLIGKWDAHRLQITVHQYKKGQQDQQTTIEPIYPSKGNMTTKRIRKLIKQAYQQYHQAIKEFLPDSFLQMYKLPRRKEAIQTIHEPKNTTLLKHARRRLIYEEFLLFQLKLHLVKQQDRNAYPGVSLSFIPDKVASFIKQLPFTLTNAQQKALKEILTDMKSPYRMNRLLQGDVGSGKTAVAAICLYASVTGQKQGALMVPTEILAEQHERSLQELFQGQANIALLTGSIKGKAREEIKQGIESGQIDIVVGTHALIQEDVIFHDLGLVIIDEQHRFGVEQRRKLREKGLNPDVLLMTATPIPRTLAISTFGDMDVSVIDEMPKGRQKVATYWVKEDMFDRVRAFIHKRVQAGEQAYVISPLIEESDQLDIQNAIDLYEKLQQYYPEHIKVGLMHGRLPNDEKERVMEDFVQNKLQILVSTTVVEVGVNVPNATVMVIYDAQRFGLSQLHQLRGRVGRGTKKSYCILIADAKGETSRERMKIMTETNDGFEIAEKDLQLRGAGDFFGHKQSGLPDFKIGDVVVDYRAMETARQDAKEIVEQNLLERDHQFYPLRNKLAEDAFVQEIID